MNNTNFAVKSQVSCYCEKCADRAERFNEKMLDKEDLMFEIFDKIKTSNIVESKHASQRSLERAFSFSKILGMVNNKLTFPISYTYNKYIQEFTLVLFTTVPVVLNGVTKQRPVHIVVGYNKTIKESTVVTSYYPDCGKNQHFWKDNYIERACFCKKDEY